MTTEDLEALREVDTITPGSDPIAPKPEDPNVVRVPANWRRVAAAAGMSERDYLLAMKKLHDEGYGLP